MYVVQNNLLVNPCNKSPNPHVFKITPYVGTKYVCPNPISQTKKQRSLEQNRGQTKTEDRKFLPAGGSQKDQVQPRTLIEPSINHSSHPKTLCHRDDVR